MGLGCSSGPPPLCLDGGVGAETKKEKEKEEERTEMNGVLYLTLCHPPVNLACFDDVNLSCALDSQDMAFDTTTPESANVLKEKIETFE